MGVLLRLAWYDGWVCAVHGEPASACPWTGDSLRGRQWLNGHAMGARDGLLAEGRAA